MFRRIMVVLDPARDLEPAKEFAIELVAKWRPSVVAIYTAYEEAVPFQAAPPECIDPEMFVGNKAVDALEDEVHGKVGEEIEVTTIVEEGPYEVVIPQQAVKEGVDLVVIGSFHAPIERRIVGSVTERVIEYAPCSVLLVRGMNRPPSDGETFVFAHDNKRLAPRLVPDLAELAVATGTSVLPILGAPQKGMEDGQELGAKLVKKLEREGVQVMPPQVLTSRWVLGPHGVVHRAVSGMMPPLAVVARYPEAPWGNATHWLVHEFVADTPCPMLFLK